MSQHEVDFEYTFALHHNTTGGNNTANGYPALYSNTTGTVNTQATADHH